MSAPPALARSPSRELLLAGAVTALLAMALANCGPAFFFPLELEAREGGSWLYVLASRAGVSIYDHQQVAFLNMNHGPMDPLLKHVLATLCPFLGPPMVTRFFVLLLPFGLVAALVTVCRANRLAGVAWGLGLYLFLLGIQPPSFLVGRSDPTALCLLGGLVAIAAGPLRRALVAGPRQGPWIGVAGVASAMVVLTNWRFAPAVGVVVVAFGLEYWDALPPERRRRTLGLYAGGLVVTGAALFGLILLTVFHGDATLYYRHFFGFFSVDSGWGALRKGGFEIFPLALVAAHWPVHVMALVVGGLGLAFPSAALPRRLQLRGWIPLLGLLWLSCCVAYYLNRSGGGLWYFAPFYVLLAVHLARAVGWERISFPWLREAVALNLLATLPWAAPWRQANLLLDSFPPAYAFLHEARALAGGEPIASEDCYFFAETYGGQTVDMGDVVFQVSATRYYGDALTETADRHFAQLRAHPPRFVIAGECASPVLNELLARRYQPVLLVSPAMTRYAGSAQTFYRLKPAAPK